MSKPEKQDRVQRPNASSYKLHVCNARNVSCVYTSRRMALQVFNGLLWEELGDVLFNPEELERWLDKPVE